MSTLKHVPWVHHYWPATESLPVAEDRPPEEAAALLSSSALLLSREVRDFALPRASTVTYCLATGLTSQTACQNKPLLFISRLSQALVTANES